MFNNLKNKFGKNFEQVFATNKIILIEVIISNVSYTLGFPIIMLLEITHNYIYDTKPSFA